MRPPARSGATSSASRSVTWNSTQKDIASPAGQELIRQLYENYCDRSKTIFFATEPIEE